MRVLSSVVLLLLVTPRPSLCTIGVQIVSTSSPTDDLCLTLGTDDATLQVFPCGSAKERQVWDVFPATGNIKPGGNAATCVDALASGNGDAIQVTPCTGKLAQAWTLFGNGKVQARTQTSSCLGSRGAMVSGSMLFLEPCNSGGGGLNTWATRLVEKQGQLPSLGGNGQQSSSSKAVAPPPPSTVFVSQSLSGGGDNTNNNPVAPPPPPPPQYSSSQSAPPPPTDHYLCACIVDKDASSCVQAVRAACTTGQIPALACKQSFDSGDHDRVTDEILKLIDNGAKCSKFDPMALRAEMNQKQARSTETTAGVPQAEDHYLCICLGGKETSEKCKSAVKSACLVGHIPAGDCQASLGTGNHDGVTEHILRLIADGSRCSQRLQLARTASCANPPCYGESKSSVNSGDKDLCTCLDDPLSHACKQAMLRTCAAGRIPKDDCDVAVKGNFWSGASRHALRLIDHGAQCPAHRSMSFTNRGCHCLQTWKEGDKTFTFPNNCADPGGKRGYSWCKTYADEACAGVEGALDWDRCDAPRLPIRRDVQVGSMASDDDPDHYLCVCVEDGVQDEVCVAAVKAACQVGHLPSAACQASFGGDHKAVSDLVVQAIKGGSKCALSQISVLEQKQNGQTTTTTTTTTTSGNVVQGNTRFCGKGEADGNGGCKCLQGYDGRTCESCAQGFFGFPDCRIMVQCSTPCGKGTCDYTDGTCTCPPNFVGPTCSQCAPGNVGYNCIPANQAGWSFGQVLVFAVLVAGLAYAGRYVYQKWCSNGMRLRGGGIMDGGIKYQPFSNGGGGKGGNGSTSSSSNNIPQHVQYDDDDFEAGIEVPAFARDEDPVPAAPVSNGNGDHPHPSSASSSSSGSSNTSGSNTIRNGLAV